MQRYQYKHGDRPLEGYTIQRAAGRGGFGEVYYAVSDSGREVAIKAVQNYEQIELRGISQCMNLKSPHLVTVFDVKYNDKNEPFVIMEYVSGPSLHDLLAESPHGLGVQKAAFFVREIAKSLSYLHECGIVHRDLKPSNIFYENGYVKVGDYGLAKAISASRHSGHTITVGTVHYMAPEIGAGSYNRSIDIYALGVLLYEMLTGDVPFIGSSPAEILMKHMTASPDLSQIEEPFARVITKALAKDPSERYQTVQEMVEDLFGSENIRNSVSQFSPEELSVVAERIAAKANIAEQPRVERPKAEVAAEPTREVGKQLTDTAQRFARQAEAMGQKVADRVDAEAGKFLGTKVRIPGFTDPVDAHQRRTLAFMAILFIAVGASLLHGPGRGGMFPIGIGIFVMITVCSQTILYSHRHWFKNIEPESQWIPKIATCGLAAFFTSIVAGFVGMVGSGPQMIRMPSYGMQLWLSLTLPMLLVDWRRISSPQRCKRLSLGSAVWIGLLGAISASIFGQDAIIIAAVLAGTSLVLQAHSTFGSATQQTAERHAKARQKTREAQPSGEITGRILPPYVRALWMIGFFITLSLGLSLTIYAANGLQGDDFAITLAFGVDSLILSLFCFVGILRHRFNGWYRYIIKPAILLVCVQIVVFSSICMGNLQLDDEWFFALLASIIVFAIAFFVIAILPASLFVGSVSRPGRHPAVQPKQPVISSSKSPAGVSSYKRLWALLLAIPGLIPVFGIPLAGLQRFYVGKIGTGILWFLTGGVFMVGQIIDVIMILAGQFRDRYGLPLEIWHDKEEVKAKGPVAVQAVNQVEAVKQEAPKARERQAETVQAAAKEDYTPKVSPTAPTTTVIYEPFHPLGFLFSGIGFILVFIAIVIGLAVGLRAPYLLAAGVPDVAQELNQAFGYSQWPDLFMRSGMIITSALLLLAAVFVIIGRRFSGACHLIRGVLGLVGLLAAVMWLSDGISWGFRGSDEALASLQIGPILDMVLKGCQSEEVIFAGVFFLVSVVILAWPARRKQIIYNPALNQGVS
jgi:hypothetical protein